MAEEYTLSVGVDADMTKFRQTLRQELEAAARQQATVPVGATAGAAGTTTVPPGGAGVSPGASATASTVAQQSAQAVANAVSRAALPFNGTVSGMSPAAMATQSVVAAAQAPRMSWANAASVFGPDMVPDVQAAEAAAARVGAIDPGADFGAAPAAMGGGRGGGQRGFGRYGGRILAGFALRGLGTVISAGQQYDVAVARAQGNERLLATAELNYRKEMFGALPLIGPGAYALNQAITGDDEYITRTLGGAEAQDERTRQMGGRMEMAQRFRAMGGIAGARGAAQQRLVAEFEFQSTTYDVRKAQRLASEESAAKFKAQRADVQREFEKKTAVMEAYSVLGPPAEAWRDAQLQAIQRAQDDAAQKNKDEFGPMLSSAEAVKRRAIEDVNRPVIAADLRNFGAARGSFLRATDRPFEASVSEHFTSLGAELLTSDDNKASILARGAGSITELFAGMFRDFGHSSRQLSAQNRITQQLLDRDPLGARITGIRAATEEAVEGLDKLPKVMRGPIEGLIRRGGGLRESLARREDDDARQLRMQSLDNRKEHYDLLAQNKQYTAQATDIKRQTEEDVSAMRQSGKFSADEIKKRIEVGVSQEQSFEAQLRRRQGAEIGANVREYAPGPGGGGPNSQEPVVKGLDAVRLAIEALRTALTGS